jgi:hypothetical protein
MEVLPSNTCAEISYVPTKIELHEDLTILTRPLRREKNSSFDGPLTRIVLTNQTVNPT